MQLLIAGLVCFAVIFALMGVWVLLSNRGTMGQKIHMRLEGVRQIKDFELGDAIAAAEEKKKKTKEKRQDVIRKKAFSDIPVLEKRFGSEPWAERLSARLRQAQMPISVTGFILISVACGAAGTLAAIVWQGFNWLLILIAFPVMAVLPYAYLTLAVTRRVKRFSTQFPDALDLLSSCVKSGLALNAAINNVADEMPDPIGDEFKIIADELTLGVELSDALRHFNERLDTPDVQFFCTALMIQKETGGNLSEVLDGLQKTIRERFRILRQVKTLTAQGRLSGWVVGLLPIVLGFTIYTLKPDYMRTLLDTPEGRKLLYVGGSLQVVGMFLIRKIVNIKV